MKLVLLNDQFSLSISDRVLIWILVYDPSLVCLLGAMFHKQCQTLPNKLQASHLEICWVNGLGNHTEGMAIYAPDKFTEFRASHPLSICEDYMASSLTLR